MARLVGGGVDLLDFDLEAGAPAAAGGGEERRSMVFVRAAALGGSSPGAKIPDALLFCAVSRPLPRGELVEERRKEKKSTREESREKPLFSSTESSRATTRSLSLSSSASLFSLPKNFHSCLSLNQFALSFPEPGQCVSASSSASTQVCSAFVSVSLRTKIKAEERRFSTNSLSLSLFDAEKKKKRRCCVDGRSLFSQNDLQ